MTERGGRDRVTESMAGGGGGGGAVTRGETVIGTHTHTPLPFFSLFIPTLMKMCSH